MNVLSGDPPRGRALQILIAVIVALLALAPFLFPRREGAERGCQDLRDDPARRLLRCSPRLRRHRLLRPCDVLRRRRLWRRTRALWPGSELGGARRGAGPRLRSLARAGAGDRPLFAPRAVDLLRHGDARRRLRLQCARFAALLAHRRRGRPFVQGSARVAAGLQMARSSDLRRAGERQADDLLPRLRRRAGRFPGALEGGQLAIRARLAGDPRKSVPRRGAGLPHRLPPHARDLHFGARRDARRGL